MELNQKPWMGFIDFVGFVDIWGKVMAGEGHEVGGRGLGIGELQKIGCA